MFVVWIRQPIGTVQGLPATDERIVERGTHLIDQEVGLGQCVGWFAASINQLVLLAQVELLEDRLSGASPDLMRDLLTSVINVLLSAEADAVCGAEYGTSSPERVTSRTGYRHRELDTGAGTLDMAIPKLRAGTYFPEWLLERRKRAEAALISVIATCYLLGVSTRRMDKLVQTLGITSLSKSQVSRMAADLDEQVTAFCTRPLTDAGPFTFVAADALTMKVRENGRVVNAVVLVATGVNADGHREMLGLKVATSETPCRVDHLLRRPGRPRPDLRAGRGAAGHLRRARRAGRGDRGEPCPAPPGSGVAPTTPRT